MKSCVTCKQKRNKTPSDVENVVDVQQNDSRPGSSFLISPVVIG